MTMCDHLWWQKQVRWREIQSSRNKLWWPRAPYLGSNSAKMAWSRWIMVHHALNEWAKSWRQAWRWRCEPAGSDRRSQASPPTSATPSRRPTWLRKIHRTPWHLSWTSKLTFLVIAAPTTKWMSIRIWSMKMTVSRSFTPAPTTWTKTLACRLDWSSWRISTRIWASEISMLSRHSSSSLICRSRQLRLIWNLRSGAIKAYFNQSSRLKERQRVDTRESLSMAS